MEGLELLLLCCWCCCCWCWCCWFAWCCWWKSLVSWKAPLDSEISALSWNGAKFTHNLRRPFLVPSTLTRTCPLFPKMMQLYCNSYFWPKYAIFAEGSVKIRCGTPMHPVSTLIFELRTFSLQFIKWELLQLQARILQCLDRHNQISQALLELGWIIGWAQFKGYQQSFSLIIKPIKLFLHRCLDCDLYWCFFFKLILYLCLLNRCLTHLNILLYLGPDLLTESHIECMS